MPPRKDSQSSKYFKLLLVGLGLVIFLIAFLNYAALSRTLTNENHLYIARALSSHPSASNEDLPTYLLKASSISSVGDPSVDPSCHVKDHMSHAKHRMDSAKVDTGNANTGGRGIDVKAFGHETVSRIPLLAVEKITRFHDPGAAAA